MWKKLDKNTYIYDDINSRGIVRKENKKWQSYVFYSFGVYTYTDTCSIKRHAQKLVEMRLGNIPWKPYFWLIYNIGNQKYRFMKKDHHYWKSFWTYATKADAINHTKNISYFTSFIPNDFVIKTGFNFDINN